MRYPRATRALPARHPPRARPHSLSSRTQPRRLRMGVRDLLFAFSVVGAPPFGFKGGSSDPLGTAVSL